MRKLSVVFLLFCVLVSASGCGGGEGDGDGGGGGGAASVDYRPIADLFLEKLFAGNFDEAKAMAIEGDTTDGSTYTAKLSAGVDKFAAMYEKYEFQEMSVENASPWAFSDGGEVNPQDFRVLVNYQFREKGTEAWKLGTVQVRALKTEEEQAWGIGDLKLIRPKR